MLFSKRALVMVMGLVLMLIVSACGGTTGTASTTPTASVPTATPVPSTIQTAQATVGGKAETILTDAKGLTLYYFTPDTIATSACTAGCATAWPPLTSSAPTSSTTLPGKLSVLSDANGSQVEYSGYLLYTFSKDTAPGQTTGENVGGKWFVATPDLASVAIRLSTATVKGKAETILTNAQGLTLYFFIPDTLSTSACTAGCATAWPPLLSASSTSAPTADAPLTETLTVVKDANGNQIECNGHMLYTFAKDTAPGQTTGEGVGGKWFVATPSLNKM